MHKTNDYEQRVFQKLVHFGENRDAIRAVVLSGSLCNPDAPSDILSDFDVELFFEDPMPFVESDEWIETVGLGPVMALWHWPNDWDKEDKEKSDGCHWVRMVYYQDGTKLDITLGYLTTLRKIASADYLPDHYDIGYRVLLDKDGVTSSFKSPTYKAYTLSPPTQTQFLSRMETFWMNSTYAAKYLWREDLVAVKWRLHQLADRGVREVLEWSVAMEQSWKWKPGSLGRGLAKALDADTVGELIQSYAAGDVDDLWESLFRTTALFRRTAINVAQHLGYNYPYDLDRRVTTYHQTIRHLNKQTGTREYLARQLTQSCEDSFSQT